MSAGSQYFCMPDWVYRSNHGQSLNFFCHCTTTSTKLGNVSELGGEFWKENFEKWIFKARNIHPIMTMFVWIKRCIFWIFIFKIHLPEFTLHQSWIQLWKRWICKGDFLIHFFILKFTFQNSPLPKVDFNFEKGDF